MKPGYIAITTVIVLTIMMTLLGTSLSTRSLYTRRSGLALTNKIQSDSGARGCIEQALLNLSLNNNYAPTNEVVTVTTSGGTLTCTIVSITTSGTNKVILTQAVVNSATTNFRLTVDAATLTRVSLEEF